MTTPDTTADTTAGPGVPGRVQAWFRANPLAADALLGGSLFVLGVPALFDPSPKVFDNVHEGDALGVVLSALLTLTLAVRRRHPIAVLACTSAALAPYLVIGYADTTASFGALVAVYSVAANCERRVALRAGAASFVVFGGLMITGVFYDREDLPPSMAVGNFLIFWGAWAIGDAFRSRRAYVAELHRRVEVADQLRAEEAALAAAAERTRIARELHDVVAHGMSAMVIQAGAARAVLDRHPDQAATALAAIEDTGRQAMAEMRRLLGVLRADAEPSGTTTAPQPGLLALGELVGTWRSAGIPVTLELAGELADDGPPVGGGPHGRERDATRGVLPPGPDLAVYRIAQEALTNVAKHAGPVREVQLRVGRIGDLVTIDVVDDGRGAAADRDPAEARTGHGLLGMRERVALYDGRLSAGPRSGGGWSVRAELDLRAGAAATARATT